MKKYSWIVALLLALSFTAIFIGCGADPLEAPPPDLGAFEEVELGDFNTWGGANDKQQGWATDGLVFKGVGDKPETAKKMGYSIDDFKAAQYLVLELAADQPSDGLRLIWGVDEGSGGGWNTGMVMTDGRVLDPCATLDGTTLTIDLAKCLPDYSSKYLASTEETGVRLVLQYWNQGIEKLGIKSAKLLIPAEFVSLEGITLARSVLGLGKTLKLEAVFNPDDATAKGVIWAIVTDTAKTTAADAAFVINETVLPDESTWPFSDGETIETQSLDTITATGLGKITVKAIVKSAYIIKESDIGKTIEGFGVVKGPDANGANSDVGKYIDFVSRDLEITVVEPKLVETISDTTTSWSWLDSTYDVGGMKGKLTKTVSDKILGYATKAAAEARLTWESTTNRQGWGCGAFGGAELTATGGSMSGVMTVNIADVKADSAGEIELNMWNDVKVTKIEIWASDN